MRNNQYCIILAGGIGTRLWPASRQQMPKQFLDILGTGETLLQATYKRYAKFIDKENIIVMSNERYKDITMQQLPQLPTGNLLLEPMRRNTVPSVVWAAIHITRINPDAVMLITPADQLITDESTFEHDMLNGFEYVAHNQRLLTVGVTPSHPETQFGYIQMNEQRADNIFQVKSFTEKPEEEFAKMFIESKEFLWNTGLFLWSARTFLETIQHVSSEVTDILQRVQAMLSVGDDIPTLIQQAFSICPNIPLETGVLEKVDNVDVMQCQFGWSDLGTWIQVFNIMQKTADDNVVLSPTEDAETNPSTFLYDTSDCIIKLPKGKIASIKDLHGYAVIDTPDILMICRKDDQQSIRNFVNDVTLRTQQNS